MTACPAWTRSSAAGGVVIVQDPVDAERPELPRRAIASVAVDHVVAVDDMPALLARLTREPAPRASIPIDVAVEARYSGGSTSAGPADIQAVGDRTLLMCPECGGPLWKVGRSGAAVYRCHLGHAATARTLLDHQSDEIEHSLWVAVRTLSERVATLAALAQDARDRGRDKTAFDFDARAAETAEHVARAREFLTRLAVARPGGDAPASGPVPPTRDDDRDASAHDPDALDLDDLALDVLARDHDRDAPDAE